MVYCIFSESPAGILILREQFLDANPTYERHEEAIKLLTNLADDAQRFPSDMELEDIRIENEWPFASGGYADVYRKSYKGQTVAVKKIRPDSASLADVVARVCGLLSYAPPFSLLSFSEAPYGGFDIASVGASEYLAATWGSQRNTPVVGDTVARER